MRNSEFVEIPARSPQIRSARPRSAPELECFPTLGFIQFIQAARPYTAHTQYYIQYIRLQLQQWAVFRQYGFGILLSALDMFL